MGAGQVEACKLFGVEEGKLLMEDIQAGSSLTVADLDGFGRMLTLICQDFQIAPAVETLIRTYQPDWVVVPIMDRGVGAGRWMHDAAWSLSKISAARFVVISSLSLAERSSAPDYPDTPVALFIGPRSVSQREKEDGAIDRAAAMRPCTRANPRCGKVQWNDRSSIWKKTNLAVE
jgi:hypothetical protein